MAPPGPGPNRAQQMNGPNRAQLTNGPNRAQQTNGPNRARGPTDEWPQQGRGPMNPFEWAQGPGPNRAQQVNGPNRARGPTVPNMKLEKHIEAPYDLFQDQNEAGVRGYHYGIMSSLGTLDCDHTGREFVLEVTSSQDTNINPDG